MAINRVDKKVDRQTLQEVGFKIGMAEWVCAKIGNDEEETNRYEATCSDSNGGSLSVVLYFDEDSTTLLGVDEVVIDASDRSVKYQIGSTTAWNMLQQAIALYALEQKRIGYTVVPVKNLKDLKRLLQVGALFEIRQHFKPGFSNQLREVAGVQTNCVWTIIHGDPEHEVSKANYGKGYRTEFRKARDYEFGETIKWYEGNAAFRDSKLIMEFVVLVPIESHEIHPASAIGLVN